MSRIVTPPRIRGGPDERGSALVGDTLRRARRHLLEVRQLLGVDAAQERGDARLRAGPKEVQDPGPRGLCPRLAHLTSEPAHVHWKLPTIRPFRPGLHLLETEVEDFDVRAAVLVGSERAVAWDTLAHPSQMEAVVGLVVGLPLTVVYSHADWDHAWGTGALAGVERVVAQEAALTRFGADVAEELRSRREREPGVWDAVRLVPPDVTFAERHTLDLGGATLELHALPGHTPDSAVGWIPEWGVLLAGDAVETPLPVVNDGAAVSGWISALRRWCADERVRVVVPSHGPVGGRELVDWTATYLEGIAEGRPLPDGTRLPPFYRETHARNVALVASATAGS